MIRRLRAWWRRTQEYWRRKRELLLEADKIMRELGQAPVSLENLELMLLRIGLLHLLGASLALTGVHKLQSTGLSRVFESSDSHRVH